MRYNHDEENEQGKQFSARLSVLLFAILMVTGLILGFINPLRPKESAAEKRKLAEFPEFSFWGFLEGDLTAKVEKWYADTYPGREIFVRAEQTIQSLYGFRGNETSRQGNGDDIPDDYTLPDLPTLPPETDEPTIEPTVKPTDAPTTEPTIDYPTEYTYETVNGQELADMNPIEAGNVNVLNGAGYAVYGFNLQAADRYAESVGRLASKLQGRNIRFYSLLAPNNSAVLLDDATKAAWNLSDERKVLAYYYGKTSALVQDLRFVNVYDTLVAHKNEYIYFRTDHHWTATGAYYAYREFCRYAGLTPHELSEYETDVCPTFLGSYVMTNGKNQLRDYADSVTYYYPLIKNEFRFYDEELGQFRTGKIVRNLKDYPHKTLGHIYGYEGFIYSDRPISYIENPDAHNGRRLLLIKDSFGNCFAPFLADHFEKVVIVDYRKYQNYISKLAIEEGITDILFLNNLEAISNMSTMNVLYDRCQ